MEIPRINPELWNELRNPLGSTQAKVKSKLNELNLKFLFLKNNSNCI